MRNGDLPSDLSGITPDQFLRVVSEVIEDHLSVVQAPGEPALEARSLASDALRRLVTQLQSLDGSRGC